ncbi:hypothetical protein ACIRU3_43545 [Streptomyces sp. NPDC101151]|uniref:hypothetical protein n=1 Tax=Streptomyces sp. NPDC101151 TaxID=3366115 RepID=UPI0038076BEC
MNLVSGKSPGRRIEMTQTDDRNLCFHSTDEKLMAVNIRTQIPRIVGASFVAAILAGTAGVVGAQVAPQTAKAAPSVVQDANQTNVNQVGGRANQANVNQGGKDVNQANVNQGGDDANQANVNQ